MAFNSRELKSSPDPKKPAKPQDVIYDPQGQWKYPGQITKIPGGNITMQGVNYPVLGVDNLGNQQMMQPGMDYTFPGQSVTEYPQAKKGGTLSIKRFTDKNIKSSVNDLMRRNETLYGTAGKRFYKPFGQGGEWFDLYQTGGGPSEPLPPPPPAADPYDEALEQYMNAKSAYEAEQQRVSGLPQTLLSNAKNKDEKNIPTRTDLGWIDQGKYFCSSHTCELLKDSGYTIPQDFTQGKTTYKAGQKIPLIPGNIAFEGMAPKMGFKAVTGKDLQPGDVVQEKIMQTQDYQGNPYGGPEGNWMPAHSLIYAGTDDQNQKVYYNSPGGARDNYAKTPIYGNEGDDYKLSGWRYVGNTEALQKQMEEAKSKMDKLPMQTMRPIQPSLLQANNDTEIKPIDLTTQLENQKNLINNSNLSAKEKRKALAELANISQDITQNVNPMTRPQVNVHLKFGGTPEAFPQQPTEKTFFKKGWVPQGPVGFYRHGGSNDYFAQDGKTVLGIPAKQAAMGPGPTQLGLQDAIDSYHQVYASLKPQELKAKLAEVQSQIANPEMFPQEGLDIQQAVLSDLLNVPLKARGGNIEAFPQQPTAKQFFSAGPMPQGPVGFYGFGGGMPEAFPQQPPANYFFAGAPWSPQLMHGGQPCLECGGHMEEGGSHMMSNGSMMDNSAMGSYAAKGGWIQDATKGMRKDKPCTGSKFGGPDCPPGSKRYNLAKTFRAMAKKQFGGDADADDSGGASDQDQDDFLGNYNNQFMNALKNNASMSLADDAAQQAEQMMAQSGMSMSEYGYNPNMMGQDMYAQKADYFDQKGKETRTNMYNAAMNLANTSNPYMEYSAKPKAQFGFDAKGNKDARFIGPVSNEYVAQNTGTPQINPATGGQGAFSQEQFEKWMDDYNTKRQQGQQGQQGNNQSQQYNTPNNQQQWNYHSQGNNYVPMNNSPYIKWKGNQQQMTNQGQPVNGMSFNPGNTYLQNYEYRGRMFGPGARKVSMTFRTYIDPKTGQKTQVPVTQNTPQTPGTGPVAGPVNQSQMGPTYGPVNQPAVTPSGQYDFTKIGATPVNKEQFMQGKIQQDIQNLNNTPTPPVVQPQSMIPYAEEQTAPFSFEAYGGYIPQAQFGMNAFGQPDPQFQGPMSNEYVQQNTQGYPQQLQEPGGDYFDTTVTGKRKMGLDKESAAVAMLAGVAGITGALNKREARKNDEDMQRMTLADNQFEAMPANRVQNQGRYNWTGMSNGMMDPNSMGVIQQPGQNFNMEGQAFSRFGGNFMQGGGQPVELDEDQINYILQNGGSIQYID